MATFNKFQAFSGDLADGVHSMGAAADTLKVYLTNDVPSAAADAVKADLAEISAGNGYTAGGEDTSNDTSNVSGTTSVTATDVSWTATGGSIGPFRYVVLYNDTAASDNLIGWWDYGSSITLLESETFTVDFDGDTLLTIA